MRKTTGLIIIMLLVMSLAACDKKENKNNASDSRSVTGEATEEVSTQTGVTETGDSTEAMVDTDETVTTESEEDINARMTAYNEAIGAFIEEGRIPPFEEEYFETPSEMNQYAICDVNGDGRDELLIRVNDGAMASLAIYVFLYENDEMRQLGAFFSSDDTKFYDNQTVVEPISHGAQTWGESFWGENISIYDEELGIYEYKYATDAWDSSVEDSWRGEDEVFPSDADRDGNGMVYWVIEFINDEYVEGEPLDDEAFRNRLDEIKGNASEIDIPWEYAVK